GLGPEEHLQNQEAELQHGHDDDEDVCKDAHEARSVAVRSRQPFRRGNRTANKGGKSIPRSGAAQQVIERESVPVPRHQKDEEDERKPWDDMLVQRVERLIEKMAKRDNGQNESERNQRVARFEAEDDQRAGDELDERNREADGPQRPHRQKRVLQRQKESLHVTGRPEAAHFP